MVTLRRLVRLTASVVQVVATALAFSFLNVICATHAAETTTSPGVLFITDSLSRPQPANVVTEETLWRVIAGGLGHPVALYSDWLDLQLLDDFHYAQTTADFLRNKYQERNIGVIVTLNYESLHFVLDNRDRIVPNAPVVYIGVSRDELDRLQVPSDVLGWTVDYDPVPTVGAASRLHPRASRLVLVSGASSWDRAWERRLREAGTKLSLPLRIEHLAGLPTADVLRRLRVLTEDAIVFTPGYSMDGAGRELAPRDSAREMAPVSGAPIYSPFDTFLGTGVVGGYMVTFEDQAKYAGKIVVDLLNGVAPAAIQTGSIPSVFMADWRQLHRWGIPESALPAGSVVLFREPRVWLRYKWQISGVLLALVLQSVLIANLQLERRRRRTAEVESGQRFSEMAHMNRSVALGQLSASIAHEINQPLGAILNNVNTALLLLRTSSPMSNELTEILVDIKRDEQRASDVVTRIRGLLRKSDFELQSIDLNAAVEETLKFVGPDASDKGVALRRELVAGLPPVRADRVQVEQVILNLALNAMDAMRDSPDATRSVTIRTARASDAEAEVSVADSGTGIQPEALERLFEPFFTTKREGMGLGLAISRTIVEAHGGHIRADNVPEGGAVIRFTIPFARGPT